MMFLLPQDRLSAVHVIRERIEEAKEFVDRIPGDEAAGVYNHLQEVSERIPAITAVVQRTYERKR